MNGLTLKVYAERNNAKLQANIISGKRFPWFLLMVSLLVEMTIQKTHLKIQSSCENLRILADFTLILISFKFYKSMLFLRRLFRPSFCLNIQKTYQIKYEVDDVTVLRGLSKAEPYLSLKGVKIPLQINKFVGQIQLPSTGIYGKETQAAQFLNENFELYHPSVPISIVIRQNFFLRWQGNLYCVMTNQKIIKTSNNPEYLPTNASHVLQPICRASLKDIDDYKTITNKLVRKIVFKNTMQEALQLKITKIRYKELLKIVEEKLLVYENQKEQIMQDIDRRSSRKVKAFTTFLLSQFGILNYLIYFHFSWDIMEPVTCIMGNIDVWIAYFFFIVKGKEFSFGVWHKEGVEAKQTYILNKHGLDTRKYNQLKELRDYLNYRLSFLSKNKHVLLDEFQGSFKMLDTR